MKIQSGRIRSVGINPNRGMTLGFAGVGYLGAGEVSIPACDPTNDITCLQNLSFDQSGNTPLSSDQASVSSTNVPAQKPQSTSPYVMLGAGAVIFILLLKLSK